MKNPIRVLVVPNITISRSPEMDSFFDVLYQQISQLGSSFHWTVPVIRISKRISSFENVRQIPIDMSGNMFHMRVNFPLEMIKLLNTSTMNPNNTKNKFHVNYDIVYSHLPDWSIRRYVPRKKKIIGYSHWWEMSICNGLSNLNNYLNFEREILGALQMEVLFVNTVTQKKVVIKEAEKTFNSKIINDLERIIQPYHLSVAKSDLILEPVSVKNKTIVFNHRLSDYKGFPKFFRWIKEFRKIRSDFRLWLPLSKSSKEQFDENWIDTTFIESKSKYLKKLTKSLVCVVPFEKHYGWSISATDAMMNGVVACFEECDNYREIHPNGLFYNSKKELFEILNRLLDDADFVQVESSKSLSRAVELSNNDNIKLLTKYLSNT